MNIIDMEIIHFFNQYSQSSFIFDSAVKFVAGNNLIKGGIMIGVFWWGWFRLHESQLHFRIHLVATLFSCFFAMVLARSLALLLPFRLRPLHEENLDFVLPYSMKLIEFDGWSSFPSDHAVLFYALAAGMFYISKKVGVFVFLYTTLLISLPRIYLGLHYPSDIVFGALIGVLISCLCHSNYFVSKISRPAVYYWRERPELFYPLFFIITYQIADMFENSRAFVRGLALSLQVFLA
ncbi:phosphatase PAP2 family protein [Zobellella maritima]|uniref:phosphatase PAP2 family protein n=1 Tax=Zobellella maritima TaxID=2059725 RepID=UPI000E30A56A|nr:phosphatase PAP2 family protein [Zobellella maritima]